MTRPKSPLRVPHLAAALLLGATAAAAGPQRAGDAGVSAGPVVAPTINAGPTVSPGLGAGAGVGAVSLPNAGLTTGVGAQAGAQGPSASAAGPSASAAPSAGAASVGAPSAAELSRQAARLGPAGSASASASGSGAALQSSPSRRSADQDPGAALMRTAQDAQTAGRAASGTGALHSAVQELGRARALEAEGLQGTTAQALDRVFDAAGKTNARVGDTDSRSAVAGKTTRVRDQIRQTVKIADTASAHDAPALYKDAIRIAEEASLKKLISGDTARAVADTVVRYAYRRAARALPDLANEAYKAAMAGAAGKPTVEKDFKSLSAWDKFLGGGQDKPLVANAAELRADVDRTLAAADQPGAKRDGVAPRVSFRREGDAFVAELPMRVAGAAAALPQDFLKSLALDARAAGREPVPALALTQTPGLLEGAGLLYSAARRGGRSAASAAAAAASFALRAAARSLWERLTALVSAVVGRLFPGRADLGAGVTLTSYDRKLGRLTTLKKDLSGEEGALLARAPAGAALAFLDLSRLEAEGRAAEQSAARGASTAGQLKAMLAQLDQAAATYARLTGDASAAAAAASLRARAGGALALPDAAPLPEDARALAAAEAPGGAAFWLARLPQAGLDFVDRQMLGVATRNSLAAVGYGDLSGAAPSARLVAPKPTPALAAELEGLGFETELGAGGALRAWASGPALAQRLEAALDRAAGAAKAPSDDAAAVARAAEFAAKNPAEARRQAQRLQAEDPALTGFAPAGVVESQGRALWAESAVRTIGGKPSRVVLLRDLDTRRPLFGRAEPLPAR
jgi:hypothetical protein